MTLKYIYSSGLSICLLLQTIVVLSQNTNDTKYPWIKREKNMIQFSDRADLKALVDGWQNTRNETLVILHLGDSHLQNENFPNRPRTLAQQALGDGGIGLIEPFSIVKSYDARFYFSTHTGNWDNAKSYSLPPKLPLGVRGMTAITYSENSTFRISFSTTVSNANNILTLFCSNNDSSYIPIIFADSIRATLINSDFERLVYSMPLGFKTITLKLSETRAQQNHFMLYGMSLSNKTNTGCIWHNAGVGASQYKSVLYEDKYNEQVNYLNPDLVIIDFGGNDFFYTNSIPVTLEGDIIKVIEKVRNVSPKASILLTSAHDMYSKHQDVTAGQDFAVLVKRIARETHCGFWDWYSVAGGPQTMKLWTANNISMNDGIHLGGAGSELKGTLLFEALEKTVNLIQNDSNLNQVSVDYSYHDSTTIALLKEYDRTHKGVSKTKKRGYKPVYITVKKGETLIQIAQKYHTTTKAIKSLNGLKSNTLMPGKKLRVR